MRKGFEAYFTVLIELFWSKQRIMEVYLNSIEMGDGIYGVKAVARRNFGCEPQQLTRRNCALIAATLPAPLRFSSKTPGPYMRSRERWILGQMRTCRASTCTNRSPVGQSPAPDGPRSAPERRRAEAHRETDCPVPSPALGAPPHLNAKSPLPSTEGSGIFVGCSRTTSAQVGQAPGRTAV